MTATTTGRPVAVRAAHPQQTTEENPVTTTVINLKGRIHDYGPRLEHAPKQLVYVGRTMTGIRAGGWHLPKHPLANPYTLRQAGTLEAAVSAYARHLADHPGLLRLVPALNGRVLACWCTPRLCHADVLAALAGAPLEEYRARLEGFVVDPWAAASSGLRSAV